MKKIYKRTKKMAFTLIELLVVLAIMGLVLSALFAGYNRFGVRLTLQNLAFTLATTIREAQVFGVFGRYQDFDAFDALPIGIKVESRSGNLDGRFILFIDKNGDKKMQSNEMLKDNKLRSEYSIQTIRVYNGTYKTLSDLYIIFIRPDSDAHIYDKYGRVYSEAEIILSSPFDDKIAVFVNSAGQISVRNVTNN